jgi:hypothetical protein
MIGTDNPNAKPSDLAPPDTSPATDPKLSKPILPPKLHHINININHDTILFKPPKLQTNVEKYNPQSVLAKNGFG